MSEGFVTSLRKYATKEQFDKATIIEDLDLDVINYDDLYDVVFENKDYKICKPVAAEGMIPLAAGTRWLSGVSSWDSNRKSGYDEIDTEATYGPFAQYNRYYVILDKHNPKKKWMFKDGYADIYVPSYARYPCATWVAENGDEKMWKWFLDQKFPYISTNLDKKVGSKLIADKTTFLYPDDAKNLTWYNKNGSNITKIEFAPGVTKISAGAFSGLQHVKEVVIPEGVKTIGNRAFYNTLIEKVTLPSTIQSIGIRAFGYCRALKEINLPEGLTKMGEGAFETATALEKMPEWPKSLDYIPRYCFLGCSSLKSINLPLHIIKIEDSAFSEVGVETIIIPGSVTSIGRDVFEGKHLKYAYIPASVKEIGEYAFGSIYHYSWDNSPRPDPKLVIDCEVSEKPEGWDKQWDLYNREIKPEYRHDYNSWDYPDRIKYYRYTVNWGVKSPRVSVKEELELDTDIDIPGMLSDEQCDKLLDIIVSIPEMAENNKEEFIKVCNDWLLNMWMIDDKPNMHKVNAYIDSLSDPTIKHIISFWAHDRDKNRNNYIITRFKEAGLDFVIGGEPVHGTRVDKWNDLCVSEDFLRDVLGFSSFDTLPDSERLMMYEDLDLDVADGFPTDYKDEHWAVYHPRNTDEYQIMADGTTWVDDVYRNGNGEDWHFTYYTNPPYYIFENLDTGEKYLYSTRENWNNLKDANGNNWTSASGKRNLGWNRTAGSMLGLFLSEMPNATGLSKWAIRKWPQGLAILKNMIKADEIIQKNGGTITYKSEDYEKAKQANRYWSGSTEGKIYAEVKEHTKAIRFPRNTHKIEDDAFRDWEALETVVLPNTVTEIGSCAFSSCESLKELKLSNRIVSIGDYAFSGDTKLTGSIFIPATCTHIGKEAFKSCKFDTIYCEAKEKPEGWADTWCRKNQLWLRDAQGNGHYESEDFNVVWGSTGPVQENLEIDRVSTEIDIPDDKKQEASLLLRVSPTEKRWDMRWWLDLEPYEETSRIIITPYKVHIGDRVYFITANLANRLLKQLNVDYEVAEPEFN